METIGYILLAVYLMIGAVITLAITLKLAEDVKGCKSLFIVAGLFVTTFLLWPVLLASVWLLRKIEEEEQNDER